MQDLTDLYQSVILDHNRRPRNYSVLPTANRVGSGNNPMCGDQITVYVKLEGDRIADEPRGIDDFFHLGGADTIPRSLDHLVAPSDEVQIPLRIPRDGVA